MVSKGRMVYVPSIVLNEVYDIMNVDDLSSRSEAFKKLSKYSKIGRGANFSMDKNRKYMRL